MENKNLKIFHNPRCRKSREALKIINDKGLNPEIIEYLNYPLNKQQLKNILSMLKYKPIELIRRNEAIWKNKYKNKNLSDIDLINAMIENPKLIERPIIINKSKAVVGRPPENILRILP